MNTMEKNVAVKSAAVGMLTIPADAVQYGEYEYAIPVEVDGEARWAKVSIAAGIAKATKTNPVFDPHAVRETWLAEKAERERKAAEKAAKAK